MIIEVEAPTIIEDLVIHSLENYANGHVTTRTKDISWTMICLCLGVGEVLSQKHKTKHEDYGLANIGIQSNDDGQMLYSNPPFIYWGIQTEIEQLHFSTANLYQLFWDKGMKGLLARVHLKRSPSGEVTTVSLHPFYLCSGKCIQLQDVFTKECAKFPTTPKKCSVVGCKEQWDNSYRRCHCRRHRDGSY